MVLDKDTLKNLHVGAAGTVSFTTAASNLRVTQSGIVGTIQSSGKVGIVISGLQLTFT